MVGIRVFIFFYFIFFGGGGVRGGPSLNISRHTNVDDTCADEGGNTE